MYISIPVKYSHIIKIIIPVQIRQNVQIEQNTVGYSFDQIKINVASMVQALSTFNYDI